MNLDKYLAWEQKIYLANKEINRVFKSKEKRQSDENMVLDNKDNLSKNNIYSNDDIKYLIRKQNINEDIQEKLDSIKKNNGITNITKNFHNSINKIEKGNLKNITHTGILNNTKSEEEEIINHIKLSDNNIKKDDIAVKIKYLEENKELKFKNLNIEIKDPNLDNENNTSGNPNTNFYEVYKIKNEKKKKKKKKKISNSSMDSEKADLLNEIQISQPTNSNILFKKLKVKYLINGDKNRIDETNLNRNSTGFNSNINNNNLINLENVIIPKVDIESNLNFQALTINNNADFEVLTRMHEIRTIDELKPSTIKIKTIDSLAAIIGMIGVKYKQTDFDGGLYLPWECVSISEPDFNKYIVNIEERIKLIKFCQKSFIKTYPDVVKRRIRRLERCACILSSGVRRKDFGSCPGEPFGCVVCRPCERILRFVFYKCVSESNTFGASSK